MEPIPVLMTLSGRAFGGAVGDDETVDLMIPPCSEPTTGLKSA